MLEFLSLHLISFPGLTLDTSSCALEDDARNARERKTVVVVQWEPLEIQIQRWWQSLPTTLKSRRYQITEIAGLCKGRYRDRPAQREIAKALRNCSWTESRDWSVAGRNKRTWGAGGYRER